ncbi:MAG: class I SAM-dependent methyltransferase [Chitinophagaceae bacterium]
MALWFEEWFDSSYYHILYKHRSIDEAKHFVQLLVNKMQAPPHASLLDLACGKGRHALEFSAFDLDVTGVDLSANSIEIAKAYEKENLSFYTHNMLHLFRINYFDIIVNLFTSFGYFASKQENTNAAKAIYAGLKKDGIFIFDFVNQKHAIANIENNPYEEITRQDILFKITRSHSENQYRKKIEIKDKDLILEYNEKVNKLSFNEAISIFEGVGLKFVEAFGSYQLDDYNEETSNRMILFFKK